jgi:hypothetical protein
VLPDNGVTEGVVLILVMLDRATGAPGYLSRIISLQGHQYGKSREGSGS